MQHRVVLCQCDVCVELGGRRRLLSSVPAWHCLKLGEMQSHCMLAQCAWCLIHRVSKKNGLELPFFYPDCNEVNLNNVQLFLEIVFRWWRCLKRKIMLLHLLLAIMEAFRSQHFSLTAAFQWTFSSVGVKCLGQMKILALWWTSRWWRW